MKLITRGQQMSQEIEGKRVLRERKTGGRYRNVCRDTIVHSIKVLTGYYVQSNRWMSGTEDDEMSIRGT